CDPGPASQRPATENQTAAVPSRPRARLGARGGLQCRAVAGEYPCVTRTTRPPMNPSPAPFKSQQYEFNDEQNRTFSQLAVSMGTVATLMKILGLVFLIFFGLQLYYAVYANAGSGAYGPAAGLGAATVLCLAIGFWTGSAAHSFRRIVETRN